MVLISTTELSVMTSAILPERVKLFISLVLKVVMYKVSLP
jgi:hypothetical protein